MTRNFITVAAILCITGCSAKIDLTGGKPDSDISIFRSKMSPGMTAVDGNKLKTAFMGGGNEVRLVAGEHDMHFELTSTANQYSWGAHYEWNVRYATQTGHQYSANASYMSGLLINKSWLVIKDETSGVEMKIEK